MMKITTSPPPLGLLLLLCIIFYSSCSFVVNGRLDTYVNIHMPHKLHKEGGYDHSINHWGMSQIGSGSHRFYGSMAMQVLDAGSDMCTIGNARPQLYSNRTGGYQPFFLLTTRGNCSFVMKARHAEQAGAAGLIIADTACLCDNRGDGCESDLPCQNDMPVLADDGSGGSLSIPTLLFKLQDARLIFDVLQDEKHNVFVDLKWQPKGITADEPLYYGMTVDIADNHTADLMQQVKPLALSLAHSQKESHAHFWPSFMLYNGTQAQCLGNIGDDQCHNTCTNNGRYCYPSQHGHLIIKEIVHLMCLWKHHGQDLEKDRTGEEWWTYVTYFDQNCRKYWYQSTDNNGLPLDHCIHLAYEKANIQEPEILACIEDAGGVDMIDGKTNVILEEQLKAHESYGILVAPVVWADGRGLGWDSPSARTILHSVCAGYNMTNIPKVCTKCQTESSDENVLHCAEQFYKKHSHRHRGWKIFFWTVFILVLVGGGSYYVYKRLVLGQDGARLGALSDGLRYAMLNDQDEAGFEPVASELTS